MEKRLFDILSTSKKGIDDQKLMEYVSNRLSQQEKYLLEEQMNDDPLLRDAADGLNEFSNQSQVPAFVQQINQNLQLNLEKPKSKKRKLLSYDLSSVYIMLGIVILIAIIAFVLLYFELLR